VGLILGFDVGSVLGIDVGRTKCMKQQMLDQNMKLTFNRLTTLYFMSEKFKERQDVSPEGDGEGSLVGTLLGCELGFFVGD
jgi:hypothetical protein